MNGDKIMKLIDIKNRNELPKFLNKNNLINCGVELGVLRGDFSKYILTHWDGKLLYSIDYWLRSNKEGTINNSHGHRKYLITKKRLSKFGNRSIVIKKSSEESYSQFEDNSLDFIYIDANHTEEYISNDITWWWPKIKIGGLMCGDDYVQRRDYGVIPVVNNFVEKNNLDLHIDSSHKKGHFRKDEYIPLSPSWYFIKK